MPSPSTGLRELGWEELPTKEEIKLNVLNPSGWQIHIVDDGCYCADRGAGAAADVLRKVRRALNMKDSMSSLG